MRLFYIFIMLFHGASSCYSGYDIIDGECAGKADLLSFYYDEALDAANGKCQSILGQLPVIHDEEHNSFYKSKEVYFLPLGLVCNTKTKKWEWLDGSKLDFKPPSGSYNTALDQECTSGCTWFIDNNKSWGFSCAHTSTYFDVWCVSDVIPPTTIDCDNFENDSEDSACYQIGTAVENWQDAEITCRNYGANLASIHNLQENNFVRRLAVSKGTVNGLYLGATVQGKATDYGWIDGTEWDYNNFYPGFPIDGLGDCLMMDTFGGNGQWMNVDCATSLAVACVRQPNTSNADVCSSGPWKEGQIIYTPGYPYDASVPCDYFLSVAEGKKVEVKVIVLEANSCCDHFLLTDSYFGGKDIANLTGYVANKVYTTPSSNLMRVSWQPNSGAKVRGAMFSYRAV